MNKSLVSMVLKSLASALDRIKPKQPAMARSLVQPKEVDMRQDVIDAGVKAIQDAEVSALEQQLGVAYDADRDASANTLTQDQADALVKAAVDPLHAQIDQLTAQDQLDAQAGADLKKKIQDGLAALSSQFQDAAAAPAPVDGGATSAPAAQL